MVRKSIATFVFCGLLSTTLILSGCGPKGSDADKDNPDKEKVEDSVRNDASGVDAPSEAVDASQSETGDSDLSAPEEESIEELPPEDKKPAKNSKKGKKSK